MGIAGFSATSFIVKVFPYSVTGVTLGIKLNPFVVDTYILDNPEPWNAAFPIDVTEAGIVIDVKPEQLENAASPIVVTEAGMIIDDKLLQFWKACVPIVRSCEPDANVMDDNLEQL